MTVRNRELDSVFFTLPYIVLITATESYMKYSIEYVTKMPFLFS